jgi:prepilin-type N-terminal cleavage/methylation domain-containing protein
MIREIRKPNSRRAFTLIELMVVIAIIALLVALSAGAVMRYLTTQKGNVTETTIAKIDSELKKARKKVIDQARNESIPAIIDSTFFCNGDVALQRVIYIKLKLMQQFPMNFTEAINGPQITTSSGIVSILGPEPAYVHYLGQYSGVVAKPGVPPASYESAACLLMALQLDRSRMSLQMDQIGSDQIKTLQNGLPYLSDGWEQPLAFYRWPTNNSEVDALNKAQANTAAAVKRDAEDPEGKLFDPSWRTPGNTGPTIFSSNVHDITNSRYLVPVIASSGPNKKIGITAVNAPGPDGMANDPTGDANDNLYNFRLTLGGKGD